MRKIGILTYHNNSNRGSILQAYALWKILNLEMKDCIIELIDYRTLSKEIKRLAPNLNIKRYFKELSDYTVCTNFYKENLRLSDNQIITNDYQKAIKFLKKQNYDMIIVGSDQIWRLEKGEHFLPTLRPFPNAYFLGPSLDCIKVSYAASANRMSYESLSRLEKKMITNSISNFDIISVRDTHTKRLLKQLGISKVNIVPDPTMIVEIPQTNIKEHFKRRKISLEKPIICVDRVKPFLDRFYKKLINKYIERGYQIVSPTWYGQEYESIEISNLKPFDYYSFFGYCDFVITRSFHSTIFSIKNRTPFLTIDPTPKNKGDKLYHLLNELSLLERYIDVSKGVPKNFYKRLHECENPLNKKKLHKNLENLRKKGLDFISELEDALNEKNS